MTIPEKVLCALWCHFIAALSPMSFTDQAISQNVRETFKWVFKGYKDLTATQSN